MRVHEGAAGIGGGAVRMRDAPGSTCRFLAAAALLGSAACAQTAVPAIERTPAEARIEPIDQAKIAAGVAAIAKGDYGRIHSLLVFRDGRLLSENYFAGEDEDNHRGAIGFVRHGPGTLHDIRSISKSVVALAVLIAHQRGHIGSLDRPLSDFFPEYRAHFADPGKAKITVRHALTMTAGLAWNEDVPYGHPDSSPAAMMAAPDLVGFVLGRKLVTPPGAKFTYNGGLTQLLADVVERSTGSNIEAFTRSALLEPLGIRVSYWAKRRDGKPDADSGLRLTSRDLGKVGLLIARRGRWQGRQLLAARLVDEAVAPHIEIPLDGEAAALGDRQAYGYQIWLPSFLVDGQRLQLIELSGNGGQKVLIADDRRLVVVITAGDYDRRPRKSSIDIFLDIVEPATRPHR